jgi:hypothetical protein
VISSEHEDTVSAMNEMNKNIFFMFLEF